MARIGTVWESGSWYGADVWAANAWTSGAWLEDSYVWGSNAWAFGALEEGSWATVNAWGESGWEYGSWDDITAPPGPGGAGTIPRKRKYDYWEVQDLQDRKELKSVNDDQDMWEIIQMAIQKGILN